MSDVSGGSDVNVNAVGCACVVIDRGNTVVVLVVLVMVAFCDKGIIVVIFVLFPPVLFVWDVVNIVVVSMVVVLVEVVVVEL